MNWLEISLTLDGDLAEAVAEVLSRYAPQGIAIESTAIESDPDGEGRPTGPVRVRAFLPNNDAQALETTRAKIEQDLFYLGMIQPLPEPVYTNLVFTDEQSEEWKVHYKPIRIGERLVIVPVWLVEAFKNGPESRPSDIHLLMEPGMAFGTGTHATTQMCLAMLEKYIQPGHAVLDVGCGSGILSVASVKLGAGRVLAVDIDQNAIPATRQNAEMNGLADSIDVRLGSLELVRDDSSPLTFNITVANILARTLVKLMEQGLPDRLTPDGALILSGILDFQVAEVVAALTAAGMAVTEQRRLGDWVALAAKRVSA